MTSPLPSSNSDPLANIAPEQLWAVWTRVAPFMVARGEPAIHFCWMLAPAGDQGLAEIGGPRGFPTRLLATVPLAALQDMSLVLSAGKASRLPAWAQAFLGTKSHQFALVKDETGQARFVETASPAYQKARVLVSGDSDDFFRVLEEGNRILNTHDWNAIAGDLRPEAQDGPINWLSRQKDPTGSALLKEFLEQSA